MRQLLPALPPCIALPFTECVRVCTPLPAFRFLENAVVFPVRPSDTLESVVMPCLERLGRSLPYMLMAKRGLYSVSAGVPTPVDYSRHKESPLESLAAVFPTKEPREDEDEFAVPSSEDEAPVRPRILSLASRRKPWGDRQQEFVNRATGLKPSSRPLSR